MRQPTTFAALPFRIEEWTLEGRPVALMAAASHQDVALAMARAARMHRPGARVRLFGKPMTQGIEPRDPSDLSFHVELWLPEDRGLDRVLGVSVHLLVGRAGFRGALGLFPLGVKFRQGAHVLADSARGDA